MMNKKKPLPLLLLAVLALALAACGSSDDDGSSSSKATTSSGAYPVSLTGAFGTTTIDHAPSRVVTLGWSDQDVVLALGVKPVGVFDIGPDFPQGVGPWGAEQIGDAKPEKLSIADGIPFEKIAALRPDLVIAVQSGVTEDDFAKLSKIAPTVTYNKGAGLYTTPWDEQAKIIGQALGQPEKAQRLVDATNKALDKAKADHPDIQGKTFSYTARQEASQVAVYTPSDLRIKFLEDLGMKLSSGQRQVAKGEQFFANVSYERLGLLDADVFVSWFNTDKDRKSFTSRPGFQDLDVIQHGGFVPLTLVEAQAQGAPTVLSIPWAIDHVVPLIEQGLRGEGPKA
ncbi:MAG TPA: iron-siderophore ABC transporter substrate-binding protein [Baekduia sp.]|uniref:iron-siderophore ABC transporter substrate-binding protein n=1 Tax=Baekduia sp. TaxID=2600305 RepID=UPI002D78DC68|nr:iron-siderophore ABC transporter substrate-binding protein [Baekduia sp.]HET6508165.1 iron-siderophore ABC transporter substrate-binding protein [Baekduia sp.]